MMKIISAVLLLTVASCSNEKSSVGPTAADSVRPEENQNEKAIPKPAKLTKQDSLRNISKDVLNTLKLKDYQRFATFIHPQKGVRFSMYGFVRTETDKHFSRAEFLNYINTPTRFTWGEKDGSGDQYVISLKDYFENWVFKRDYTQSDIYLNEFKGTGNSLNNLQQIYPNADFTENYIAGSEKYAFMDWNALRLVFEKFEGKYFLIAVVNDQWTI
ncbi:hypothetical protein FIC_01765 [Flavobacteriaceae bacterium 3519-10]|nr:hypothetical protein FIC_01765 [Flavobacteriaceae bacterium 3519-10]